MRRRAQSRQHVEPVDPAVRAHLLDAAFRFIDTIRGRHGITKIALIGSLTTDKPNPKDVDFLVTVDDDLDLRGLAKQSRRLLGMTQQNSNHGTDVFLANLDVKSAGAITNGGGGQSVPSSVANLGTAVSVRTDVQAVYAEAGSASNTGGPWTILMDVLNI